MSLTKRVVTERVRCRYRLPGRTTDGTGFSGGVNYDEAAERIHVELEEDATPPRLHLWGEAAALRAFGEYLVALSDYGGFDPDYHDHFDDAALIVHAPSRDDHLTRVTEEFVDTEVTYLDDTRRGLLDASGIAPPAHEQELAVGFFLDEGTVQFHLGGSRRALRNLGAYLLGLATITTPGYEDLLYHPGRYGTAPACQLALHAPVAPR